MSLLLLLIAKGYYRKLQSWLGSCICYAVVGEILTIWVMKESHKFCRLM